MTFVALIATDRGSRGREVAVTGAPDHLQPDPSATTPGPSWRVDTDGDATRLRAVGDRWGMVPLYWWADRSAIVVADRVEELLAASARLGRPRTSIDAMAAATMLALGQPAGDLTVFQDVHVVPPDATLTWTPGSPPTITSGGSRTPAPSTRDRSQRLDAFLDAFAAAVTRRLPGREPVVVPLSGGADSRHIVLELARQGVPIAAVVTAATHRHDPELLAARRLAARLGIAHRVVRHRVGDLAMERRANTLTSGQASELAWYLPVVDHLDATAAVTYDGLGGDVLSAALYQTSARVAAVRAGDWRALIDDLTGGRQSAALRQRFVPAVVEGRLPPREEVVAELAAQWRRHADEPNPLGWAMFSSRTRRHIAMGPCAMLAGIEVHTPYLDPDVVEVLRAMPMEDPVDHRFHRDAIARRFPEAADVPYDDEIATSWQHTRAGARRRAAALRLMTEARNVWRTPSRARVATLPSVEFKSFKEVRRAITVHQAAEQIRGGP